LFLAIHALAYFAGLKNLILKPPLFATIWLNRKGLPGKPGSHGTRQTHKQPDSCPEKHSDADCDHDVPEMTESAQNNKNDERPDFDAVVRFAWMILFFAHRSFFPLENRKIMNSRARIFCPSASTK
jgi:hypothetical protein